MTYSTAIFITAVAAALIFLAWVSRKRQIYHSVHRFDQPPEMIFRAYFPEPSVSGADHPFRPHAPLEIAGPNRVTFSWQGLAGWWETTPFTAAHEEYAMNALTLLFDNDDRMSLDYLFEREGNGTRVTIVRTVERGKLTSGILERLAYPFNDFLDAAGLRRSFAAQDGLSAKVPMVARTPLALAFAAIAIAGLVWTAGWITGLGLAFVLFVHELGHVLAARWYGHRTSSFIYVPFFGGLANVGPSASHAEHVVKTLAGPALGLLACFLCAVLAATPLSQNNEAVFLGLTVITIVHAINLLPFGMLDGGQVLRAILLSVDRVGRWLWLAFGGMGLVLGMLFAWWIEAWPLMIFFGVGAFALHNDIKNPGTSELPPLGRGGKLAATVGYLGLIAGHVTVVIAPFFMIGPLYSAYYSLFPPQQAIVLSQPEQLSALYVRRAGSLDDILLDSEGWRTLPWGENLITGRVGNRIALQLDPGRIFIRTVHRDGRDCLLVETLFHQQSLTVTQEQLQQSVCRQH